MVDTLFKYYYSAWRKKVPSDKNVIPRKKRLNFLVFEIVSSPSNIGLFELGLFLGELLTVNFYSCEFENSVLVGMEIKRDFLALRTFLHEKL